MPSDKQVGDDLCRCMCDTHLDEEHLRFARQVLTVARIEVRIQSVNLQFMVILAVESLFDSVGSMWTVLETQVRLQTLQEQYNLPPSRPWVRKIITRQSSFV